MSALGLDLRLAARYLAGRKLRTFLTTLAVVFGVTIIFGLNGIMPGVIGTFKQSMLAATGKVDLTVQSASGGSFSPAIASKISGVEGVAAVSPTLRKNLALPPGKYDVSAVSVVGVNPDVVGAVRSIPVKQGRFIEAADNLAIAMSQDLAADLKVKAGDDIELPTAQGLRSFRVTGLLSLPVIPGNEEVFVPLATAQYLFNETGNVNAVDVAYAAGADPDSVKAAIQEAVGSRYTLEGEETGSEFFAAVQMGQTTMNIFGIFALAMGGFIILNTFRTVVSERRRDIGMLRAVGASRRTILGMFLAESLIQGVLGTGVGLLAGYGVAIGIFAAINPIYQQYLNMELAGSAEFSVTAWILAVGLGVGVTVLGALLPALSARRLTPLDALRPQMAEVFEKTMGRRGWTGAVLIAFAVAGLLSGNSSLVGLSVVLFLSGMVLVAPVLVKPISDVFSRLITLVFVREGDVSKANLQRNPGRAAVTASTMMVSVAIIIAMLGMMTSIVDSFMRYVDKSIGADFVAVPTQLLLSAGNAGAGPKLASDVRGTAGVSEVATLRLSTGRVKGSKVQFIGIDPATYPKVSSFAFSEGTAQGDIAKLARGRRMFANGIYASQAGIGVGDSVRVQTPNGPRTYEVAGIANDFLNAKLATAYVSQENLGRDFNARTDLLVMANAAAGANKKTVRAELDKTLADYPQFKLYDATKFRGDQRQTIQQ
ncbi:MAG: FtsX-like permease family protein, partial [Actinobacteria bacterium]